MMRDTLEPRVTDTEHLLPEDLVRLHVELDIRVRGEIAVEPSPKTEEF